MTLQVLFAFDAQSDATAEHAREVALGASDDLASVQMAVDHAVKAWDARKLADDWATRLAPQWPTHRQPAADRAILRLAIWELTSMPTPPKVVLDEAIELAREYSTENSPAFVNGVLDAVLKEITALKAP